MDLMSTPNPSKQQNQHLFLLLSLLLILSNQRLPPLAQKLVLDVALNWPLWPSSAPTVVQRTNKATIINPLTIEPIECYIIIILYVDQYGPTVCSKKCSRWLRSSSKSFSTGYCSAL